MGRRDLDSELGAQIREMRLARGWTVKELADWAGVTRKTIYDLEAGKDVMAKTLLSVLKALSHQLTIVEIPRQRTKSK